MDENSGAYKNSGFIGDTAIDKGAAKSKSGSTTTTTGSIELANKQSSIEKQYDPYLHRKVKHPTSNLDTFIHLLKGSLGTGILAMPNAFLHSGYALGAIGTIIIGFVCTYCIHLLLIAEYELCKRKRMPCMSYPTVAEYALLEGPQVLRPYAPHIVHITNAFLLIYQLGSCCVYVVFVASQVKSVVDTYTGQSTDIRLYMLIILLPLILVSWIRNLKFLAPFSSLANLITLVSFGIIGYYIFRDPITFHGKKAVGPISEFPLFFGTVLFALEAIGVVLPLENEMKTPRKFGSACGVLNNAMVFITILYFAMGLFGYMKYGDKSLGSITLNLPKGDTLAQVVKAMLAFAIFVTHALSCYVAIDITWNDYVAKRFADNKKKIFYEYIVRTLLVLVTFLLAVAIPNLELFISLFGAFCLSALALALPALIQTCTYWHTKTGYAKALMIIQNIIISIIAVVGLVAGTYSSLTEIVKTFT